MGISGNPIPAASKNCDGGGTFTDFELVCASTDGRLLLFDATTGVLTEMDGSPVVDGATAVRCETDVEYATTVVCVTDGVANYSRVTVLAVPVGTVVATLWFSDIGDPIAAPAGPFTPCADQADVEFVSAQKCFTDGVAEFTQVVIIDATTGTVSSVEWLDATGVEVPTPVGPLSPCGPVSERRMVASEQWCVTVPDVPEQCVRTDTTIDVAVVGTTLVSGAPGGPYVLTIETASQADTDALLIFWTVLTTPGTRAEELIDGNSVGIWLHDAQVASAIEVDPTHVNVVMVPSAPIVPLTAPCVDDPTWDYAATAAILTGAYDGAGNGAQVGGPAQLTFNVRHYQAQAAIIGSQTPVERRKWQELDGTITIEDFAVDPSTGAETPFVAPVNGAWSQGACDGTLGACEGTPVETTVVQPATGTAFMGWLSVPINSTLADAIECSAVGGTAADAIVIDGITRDYVSIGMLRAVATILDGEQFDSLDWDDIFTSPFSPPIVWTLGTDPTGSIAASDLENWIATSILGRGVSFCAVKVTPEVSGSQCQFRVEIYGVPSGGPLPLYLVSPTHLTSEFQFLPQTAYAELDAQIPIAAPSGCELAGTTASVTIAGTFPVGEEIYLGALIDNAGTPVFLNGATPYESVIGTGAPQVATFTFNLTDIDWTSGTPYALTAADLAGLTAWTWFGTLSAPGLAFEVDGFEGAATFACPTPGEPAVRTVICDEQLDALATQIINGLTPAPGRIFQPHMVELTGGGYSTVNLSGVRSYSLLVLAGSVQILPPLEAPITLEIGESVQFEVDNPDRFDPSLSISSQGLTVDAKWHVSWEVTP